jgi:hypothetical protein
MTDLTEKYLNKELVNSIPEKLPPDYDEWLNTVSIPLHAMNGFCEEQDERELEMEWAPDFD